MHTATAATWTMTFRLRGRPVKDMINIPGRNVYSAEVEKRLAQHRWWAVRRDGIPANAGASRFSPSSVAKKAQRYVRRADRVLQDADRGLPNAAPRSTHEHAAALSARARS